MDDLIVFVKARLDEDEAVARAAANFSYGVPDWCDEGDPDGVHIARHDPARTLREVACIRSVIEMTEEHLYNVDDTYRLFAAIWSDHPDWRSEWAA